MNFSHTFITGGSYLNQTHIVQSSVKGGFERLQEAVAPGAFHNSGERFDPPKCHPNTRLAVLRRLMDWILRQDPDTRDALLMWLYGPAGAGKSAIAQTLAEMCYAENKLLASFFFARNDPVRGTAQRLISTLAYQLALNLPQQVREQITLAIDHNPLIFTLSLEAQLTALIVQPVNRLAESGFFNIPRAPRLIIIDGLDECNDRQVQSHIIRTIFLALRQQSLPLIFLIASRPESDISASFDSHSPTSPFARLALDNSYLPKSDIRVFLKDRFEKIKQTHKLKKYIPRSWPTEDVVNALVGKSSGQFIYASTVARFVSSTRHRPTERLEIILGIRVASGEAPFAELDALYTHIFSTVDDIAGVQKIMGLLILVTPGHFTEYTEALEHFLHLNPGDLSLILSDLGSLISLANWRVPRILHASLKDFLLDPSRSKDMYLNPAERHAEYSALCFKHLKNNSLDSNILYRLFYHSSLSPASQELRDNIARLSIKSLGDAAGENSRYRIPFWVSDLLSLLDSLTWDTDKRLHQNQLEFLDQFFMRHLNRYYSDPFLILVVAVLPNKGFILTPFYPSLPWGAKMVDNDWLIPDLFREQLKVRELFASFLEDPVRAGKYFLDGTKYACAASAALTFTSVFSRWSHPLPAVHSEPDNYIRRNAPRRWLEKWGRTSLFYTLRTKHKPQPRTPRHKYLHPHPYGRQHYSNLTPEIHFNIRKNPWKKHNHARTLFRFALLNIPYVLKRAEKSHELFDFARQMQFGPRAKNYPRSIRLAKKAIQEYLARFLDEV